MARHVTKRRILVLMHEEVVPPDTLEGLSEDEIEAVRTEEDVVSGLRQLGHEVHKIGVIDDLGPLRRAIDEVKPHCVFNLLEDWGGEVLYDFNIVAYLELQHMAYTGCCARGLLLARDKALSKKILHYHRIRLPRFATFKRGKAIRRPKQLELPAIVKSQIHEASLGIAKASVVNDEEALIERVRFIHDRLACDAIVEQYIPGRELYSAVLGNQRLEVLPTWELKLEGLPDDAPRIATRRIKWDRKFQQKYGIDIERARVPAELARHIADTSRRICHRLGLDGYVRIDYRLGEDGKLYFLEANPNPQIADKEELASAAAAAGLPYPALLQRIVSLGMRRRAGS